MSTFTLLMSTLLIFRHVKALTEGIHSKEALEMVKDHLMSMMGPTVTAYSNQIVKMSKLQMTQVYAASVMFGYFLRRYRLWSRTWRVPLLSSSSFPVSLSCGPKLFTSCFLFLPGEKGICRLLRNTTCYLSPAAEGSCVLKIVTGGHLLEQGPISDRNVLR